jgi:hypothetical protein
MFTALPQPGANVELNPELKPEGTAASLPFPLVFGPLMAMSDADPDEAGAVTAATPKPHSPEPEKRKRGVPAAPVSVDPKTPEPTPPKPPITVDAVSLMPVIQVLPEAKRPDPSIEDLTEMPKLMKEPEAAPRPRLARAVAAEPPTAGDTPDADEPASAKVSEPIEWAPKVEVIARRIEARPPVEPTRRTVEPLPRNDLAARPVEPRLQGYQDTGEAPEDREDRDDRDGDGELVSASKERRGAIAVARPQPDGPIYDQPRGEVAFSARLVPDTQAVSKVSSPAPPDSSQKADTKALLPEPGRIEPEAPGLKIQEMPKAQAAREIRLAVDGGERRVEVQLTERAGEVRVAVRTPDVRLAGEIRENLPNLSSRLEQTGYRMENSHDSRDAQHQSGQDGREHPQRQQPAQEELPRRKQKGKSFEWLMSSLR